MIDFSKLKIADLRKLCIEHGHSEDEIAELTKPALIALLESGVDETANDDLEDVSDSEKVVKSPKKGSVIAIMKGDTVIRVYSKEKHGEDFEDLAEAFCEKDARFSLKDATEIAKVRVSFKRLSEKSALWEKAEQTFTSLVQALAFASQQAEASCVVVTYNKKGK